MTRVVEVDGSYGLRPLTLAVVLQWGGGAIIGHNLPAVEGCNRGRWMEISERRFYPGGWNAVASRV